MMCLSQTTRYALHALSCLKDSATPSYLVRDISELLGIPQPYLAKIFTQLSRKGIVLTRRGHHGGVVLARPAKAITLLAVIEALEGREWVADCLLSIENGACNHHCPTREGWQKLRDELKNLLRKTTVDDLNGLRSNAVPPPSPGPASKRGTPAAQKDQAVQAKRRSYRGFEPLGWPVT